jgi:hypothetical protein
MVRPGRICGFSARLKTLLKKLGSQLGIPKEHPSGAKQAAEELPDRTTSEAL